MARHAGRGFSTIEYPTGMNQNGDPTQAWIKLKPDGRVDVFAGTVDIGQGSKTVHTQIVADTLGVPYDWVTMDNSNTDSSAVCTGTFASRGTFIGGNAVRFAAERVRERILDIASKELEISADDLEIVDGEVQAKGAPDRKISIPDVAGLELGSEYRQMTPERRSGDLLPEHLVAQQAPDGEHLATYRGAASNGGGR